jgi:hypothetical protein
MSSMIWNSRTALLFGIVCGMALRLRDLQLTEARIGATEGGEMLPMEHFEHGEHGEHAEHAEHGEHGEHAEHGEEMQPVHGVPVSDPFF